jgi:hypothetical protein
MITTLAVAFALAAHNPPPACSRLRTRTVRPSRVLELTLRATPDSMPDVLQGAAAMIERVPWDTAAVHGQVFEVVRVEGGPGADQIRGHRRAVLIWWRDSLACQRMAPQPAVRENVNDLFLLARPVGSPVGDGTFMDAAVADLRPASQWIAGMPTFDVTPRAWTYSPTEPRPVNLPPTVQGALTISEYRDFFAHVPTTGTSPEARQATWRRMLSWADADPRRWTLYPAAGELCAALVNTGATNASAQRCPT